MAVSAKRSNGAALKFVIWAPSFDPTAGGAIALHHLCHRLNLLGHDAKLWPADRPCGRSPTSLHQQYLVLRHALGRRDRGYQTGPFPNRLATHSDLGGAIAVYPEIVEGNPLRSPAVVRWLLHRPGHFTGRKRYNEGDLFFYFQDAFNDPSVNSDPDNKLALTWVNSVYRDLGLPDRSGSCYLVRKGKDRPLVHDLTDSVPIDELSHDEKALIFNQSRAFYCYDPYTMYLPYAAVCGCIPIVVPVPGVSRDEWLPNEHERLGIAYGEEEIDWAVRTRSALLERMRNDYENQGRMLLRFVERCRDRFAR